MRNGYHSSLPRRAACSASLLLVAVYILVGAIPGFATDVDGPDCVHTREDFGDAPETTLAYPGVIGHFPTCVAPSAPGTQELGIGCPPVSTPPGLTGFVAHLQIGGSPDNYWIGCYPGPMGIDSETDGKVNTPPTGFSVCGAIPTDCVEATMAAFLGLSWDQDECYADGSDAGLTTPPSFATCTPGTFTIPVYNCNPGVDVPVFLNVLLDMNADGDWNDTFACLPGGLGPCAFEWGVKNVPIVLLPFCNTVTIPPFMIGPNAGPGWLRISISGLPMPDDYPWAGIAGLGGGDSRQFGGETEDYPVMIAGNQVPTDRSTWGKLKIRYR